MSTNEAAALARLHGARRFLVEGLPESGPWLAHPRRVVELVHLAARDLPSEALADAQALAWTCDLLAETAIGVPALTAGLGRNRSALARMASRSVRGVEKTTKSPEVYWRVVARGPASVRVAAVCALVARLEEAARWPSQVDLTALRHEAMNHAVTVVSDLPEAASLLQSAICEPAK